MNWGADISRELSRAKVKFPTWPTDPLHAVAVLQEEVGELQRATLQCCYEPDKATIEDVMTEAIQVGAMVFRFLDSLYEYQFKPGFQHHQHVPCAACDRSDYQLGHSDDCLALRKGGGHET